jgi:hypothetical protein
MANHIQIHDRQDDRHQERHSAADECAQGQAEERGHREQIADGDRLAYRGLCRGTWGNCKCGAIGDVAAIENECCPHCDDQRWLRHRRGTASPSVDARTYLVAGPRPRHDASLRRRRLETRSRYRSYGSAVHPLIPCRGNHQAWMTSAAAAIAPSSVYAQKRPIACAVQTKSAETRMTLSARRHRGRCCSNLPKRTPPIAKVPRTIERSNQAESRSHMIDGLTGWVGR